MSNSIDIGEALFYGSRLLTSVLEMKGSSLNLSKLLNEPRESDESLAFTAVSEPLRVKKSEEELGVDIDKANIPNVVSNGHISSQTVEERISHLKLYTSETAIDRAQVFTVLINMPEFDLSQQDYQGHSLLTYLIACGEPCHGPSGACNEHSQCWDRFALLEALCAHPGMTEQLPREGVALFHRTFLTALELACAAHYYRACRLLLESFSSYYKPKVVAAPSAMPLRFVKSMPGKSPLEILLDYNEIVHAHETHFHRSLDRRVLGQPYGLCRDDPATIKLLIVRGADCAFERINSRQVEVCTALHQAVCTGNPAVLQALIDAAPTLMSMHGQRPTPGTRTLSRAVFADGVTGVSPLELACHIQGDYSDVARVLLRAGAKTYSYEGGPGDRFDCLTIAALAGNWNVLKTLLDHIVAQNHLMNPESQLSKTTGISSGPVGAKRGSNNYSSVSSSKSSSNSRSSAKHKSLPSRQSSGPGWLVSPPPHQHSVEAAMTDALRFCKDIIAVQLIHREGHCDLSACDGQVSLLLLALESPIAGAVDYLVQHGADPTAPLRFDASFLSLRGGFMEPALVCTVLHVAIIRGQLDAAHTLCRSPLMDVSRCDSCGRPAAALLGAACDAYSMRRYTAEQRLKELNLLPSLLDSATTCRRDLEGFTPLMALLLRDRQWHIKLHPAMLNGAQSPTLGSRGEQLSIALPPALEITTVALVSRYLDLVEHVSDLQSSAVVLTQYAPEGGHTLPIDLVQDLWRGLTPGSAEGRGREEVLRRLSAIARNTRLSSTMSDKDTTEKLRVIEGERLEHDDLQNSDDSDIVISNASIATDRLSTYDRESLRARPASTPVTPSLTLSLSVRLMPDCEGTLLKQSDWLKEWRPRYFILYDSCLFVCRSAGSNPQKMIDLSRCRHGLKLVILRLADVQKVPQAASAAADDDVWDDLPVLRLSSQVLSSRGGQYLLRSVWTGAQRCRQAMKEACEADLIRWLNALANTVTSPM